MLAIEDDPKMPSLRRLDASEYLSKSAPADDLAAAAPKLEKTKEAKPRQ